MELKPKEEKKKTKKQKANAEKRCAKPTVPDSHKKALTASRKNRQLLDALGLGKRGHKKSF